MIIPINDKYRIASNADCWMLQEYKGLVKNGKKAGQPKWDSIKWAGRLDHIVNCLAQRLIQTSEAQTLSEALVEVDRVTALLCGALSPDYDVRVRK